MQRTIKATPEELFADATAFMVNNGSSVSSQAGSSITFAANQGIDPLSKASMYAVGAFDLAAAFSGMTAFAVASKQSATLVAVRKGDQTTITIPDLETVPANLSASGTLTSEAEEFLRRPRFSR